jgi:hypothetical protein
MCVLYKKSCDLLNTKPGDNSFNGLSLDHLQQNALANATPVYNGTTNSSSACSHAKLNKIILVYKNPNKMHKSQSLFYLTTALHVSSITITHLQEHKITVTTGTGEQNPSFQLTINTMLTSAITRKQKQINMPPTLSNQFQLFHDSSRQQYSTYIIHYSIELTAFSAEYTLFNNCNFNLVYRYSLSVNLTLSITA